MEKKFSQGEWKTLDKAVFNPYQNVWSKALYVNGLSFCMYIAGRTEAEAEANAKLIAAAPGLLEACIKLKEWNDKYPPGRIYDYSQGKAIENELTSIVKMQFEAIKKATE